MPDTRETVPSAEVIRNFGYWQQQALIKPMVVTHHGRARVMLISTDHYEELSGRDETLPEPDKSINLDALLTNSSEGFMLVDAELKILDANQTTLTWLGCTLEDIRGQPADRLGATTNLLFGSMLRRVMRSGEAVSYEFTTSPSSKRLSARSYPFGKCVASVFVDITEQESFRDAADMLDASTYGLDLLDTMATAEVDGDGRIKNPSVVLQRMMTLSAADLEALKLVDLLDPASRDGANAALSAAMTNRKSSSLNAALLGRGGPHRAISLSVVPLERGLTVKGAIVAIARQTPVSRQSTSIAGAS